MESTVFYLVMTQKIYQFKTKISKIKPYPLCVGKISNDFIDNSMKKQD